MNTENNVSKQPAAPPEPALLPTGTPRETAFPAIVEAEKMFVRFAALTRETAQRAYEFFVRRGGELGRDFEDWFKAESELLRPVAVEITETDKAVSVTAAVPGFKPEEIEISVDGDVLILSGETRAENRREDECTVYSEWRGNRFLRRLTLPAPVNADRVRATLRDGVLQLKMPKAAPREARQIAVAAG